MTKLHQISNKQTCKGWDICINLWMTGISILYKFLALLQMETSDEPHNISYWLTVLLHVL